MVGERFYVSENHQGVNLFHTFTYKTEQEKRKLTTKARKTPRFKFFLDSEEGREFVDANKEMIDAVFFFMGPRASEKI